MGGPNNDFIPGGSYIRGNYPALDKALDEMGSPMPDRAVVDGAGIRAALRKAYDCGCDKCGGDMVLWQDIGDMKCQSCGRTGDEIEDDLRKSPPRSLVALSEDRQWLVVLQPVEKYGKVALFRFYRKHDLFHHYAHAGIEPIEDTGQDAHEVLRDAIAAQLRAQDAGEGE